ncbi:MAG: hypothetical protein K0S28_1500 [Paucimonas sp.]|nr:hypothetical protein [Paucimonas sp.]
MPGDSDGTGKAARFNQPEAITRDAEGNLYVADNGNAKIKKVCPGAQVSTVANVAALSPFAVKGLAVDGKGSVYFSNLQGVHKLVSATQIAPVGSGIGSLGRLAIDSKGDVYTFENLYLSNIPDESVGQSPAGLRRITATQTEHVWDYRMSSPQGTTNNEDGFTDIVLDEATKNLYISSDRFNVVAKLSYEGNYAGTHDTVPGITLPGTQRIQRLATDTQGRIYAFTNVLGKIYQIMPDGSVSAVAGTGTSLSIPSAGAVTIRSIVGTGPKTFAFTAGHAVYEIKLP